MPTYLNTYASTYLHTYLLAGLRFCIPAYPHTYMPICRTENMGVFKQQTRKTALCLCLLKCKGSRADAARQTKTTANVGLCIARNG